MVRVLGLSASLRSARFGQGTGRLVESIDRIATREALLRFIADESRFLLTEFFEKGRREGRPFDELYDTLRRARGDRGLSNSEAALAASLWGCLQGGAEVDYIALSSHFPPSGEIRNTDALREATCAADAIILSGPVYFGDRGSMAQRYFEFLHADPRCRESVRGKVFAGLAVGAKRNGGQETTLIYQLVDATNLDMLAVGNDHETTAQYGGTVVAGDVGNFHKDDYGFKTVISTGRRVANAARLVKAGSGNALADPVRIGVWLLQDEPDGSGHDVVLDVCTDIAAREPGVAFDVVDFTRMPIYPCIACDVCPTSVGPPDQYRCVVTKQEDGLVRMHRRLLTHDAYLLAAFSPKDRTHVRSVYQTFVERTRYLRRDDYLIGDRLTAPFVISELGANQNLHLRMLTSGLRHHTILHHPMIGWQQSGEILNRQDLVENGVKFARAAKTVTAGRLATADQSGGKLYNPVGYIVSQEKQLADLADGSIDQAHRTRGDLLRRERVARLR